MCEFSLTKSLVADKTRYDKTYGEKEKICSSTTCYSEMLLAIYSKVVAQHSPAETEETDVYGKKPSSHEEETVKREFEFHSVLWFLVLYIKCVGIHKTYTCYDEGKPEHKLKIVCVSVDEKSYGRSYGGCEVVAHAIETYALISSRSRKDINCHCGVCYGGSPERSSVKRSE